MVYACIAAVAVSCASLGVALLFLVRQREYSLKVAIQLNKHEDRLNSHADRIERLKDKQQKAMDAHSRSDDARAKLLSCAFSDRIDALSARLDAVELETGIREKPKTMGGVK